MSACRPACGPGGGVETTSGRSLLRSVRSMSARRTGDPRDSRGAVKTRPEAAPHTGHATAAVADPIAHLVSVGPCSGQR
jgi:hypothetical protein